VGIKTAIQWCDSTCNPAMGCAGCELSGGHCYAEAMAARMHGARGWPKKFKQPQVFPGRIEEALTWPDLKGTDRRDKPWLNGMPRVIFLCDLGDPFTPGLPDDWLARHVIEMAQRHIWILLSKWPARMGAFVEWWQMQFCERWPRNIWLGTSVTSEKSLGRIAELRKMPAAVRLVSMEPLLERIDVAWRADGPVAVERICRCNGRAEIDGYDAASGSAIVRCTRCNHSWVAAKGIMGFDWLITGGQSGRGARPCQFGWIRRLIADARGAHVPIFVKQVGSNPHGDWLHGDPPMHSLTELVAHQWITRRQESQCKNGRWKLRDPKGGNWDEWPEDLRVREMPDWRSIL